MLISPLNLPMRVGSRYPDTAFCGPCEKVRPALRGQPTHPNGDRRSQQSYPGKDIGAENCGEAALGTGKTDSADVSDCCAAQRDSSLRLNGKKAGLGVTEDNPKQTMHDPMPRLRMEPPVGMHKRDATGQSCPCHLSVTDGPE